MKPTTYNSIMSVIFMFIAIDQVHLHQRLIAGAALIASAIYGRG